MKAWNPHNEPERTAYVRMTVTDHDLLKRAATAEKKPLTDWCREALLLVAAAAVDTARYHKELEREHDEEESCRDCDEALSAAEIEIEIETESEDQHCEYRSCAEGT
jgi:uncharacterized protein (DUF1778 family)